MRACGATLKSGAPCTNKSKVEHPEHGPLCGVHLRCVSNKKECCICLDTGTAAQCKQLGCGHTFHRRCIQRWFKRGSLTCPMCRVVCFEELGSSHPLVSARLRHFLRVAPVPAGIPFTAFMLGMLNSPPVVEALGLSNDDHQLLVELAYQSFTQEHFFEYLRHLHM